MYLYLRSFVVVLACVVGLADRAGAQSETEAVDALVGIEPIAVVVEDVSEAARQDGLTREVLQAAVEERLRQAGVPRAEAPGPYLYVNVNAMKLASAPAYAYSINVELKQRVQVVRAGDVTEVTAQTGSSDAHVATGPVTVGATTWSVGKIGYVPTEELPDVRDAVVAYVDDFSRAYFAANPR